jgi:hypothetical protein
MHPLR